MHSLVIVRLDCEFFGVLFCIFHHHHRRRRNHRRHHRIDITEKSKRENKKQQQQQHQNRFGLIGCALGLVLLVQISKVFSFFDCCSLLLLLFHSVLCFWAAVVVVVAIEFVYIWKKVCWRCHRNICMILLCVEVRVRALASLRVLCVWMLLLLLLLLWVIFQLKSYVWYIYLFHTGPIECIVWYTQYLQFNERLKETKWTKINIL